MRLGHGNGHPGGSAEFFARTCAVAHAPPRRTDVQSRPNARGDLRAVAGSSKFFFNFGTGTRPSFPRPTDGVPHPSGRFLRTVCGTPFGSVAL